MRSGGVISLFCLGAALSVAVTCGSAFAQPSAGSALVFDGLADSVVVSNSPMLELTSGTIELWFRPDWTPGSLNYDPVLVANQLGPVLTRYSLRVDRNLAGIILANGSSVSSVPFTFTPGAWCHVAVAANGPSGQVYVNGLFIGTTGNGFGTLIGLPLNLGSDGTGEFFQGAMDEVRLWNVTRSATDIRYNVSRALAGNEAGLVAYWRLDEGAGITAADATANGFDGAVNGASWTNSDVVLVNTSGSFGTALDFTSSRGSFVQVPSSPSLALSNQFSFEAWIKPRTAQCNTILARGDGLNFTNTDFVFQVGNDGTNCGVMKLALMVAGGWTASASTVPLNAWTHVAVTCDGDTNRFYINGLQDNTVAVTGSVYQSSSPLFIGRQGTSGSNYFDGTLDEIRVWNSVRSPAQIQTNLSRALGQGELWLIGYWRFNEQAGIHAIDYSGRFNNGKFVNRPVRVTSFSTPGLQLLGANPFPQECHVGFTEPGFNVNGMPLALGAGLYHSLTVKRDGSVVAWGQNTSGQANVPSTAANSLAVAAGQYHSIALRNNRTLVAWGGNDYGVLNIPPEATNVIGISAGNYHNLVLKEDGSVLSWGTSDAGLTNVPAAATNIVTISASPAVNLALRADGSLLAWGYTNSGQTHVPPTATDIVAVAAGGSHCLALRADGRLVGWGDNLSGQTSIPASAVNVVAIAAGAISSLALRVDGTVVGWGGNNDGSLDIPSSATNIVQIASFYSHSLALRADGTVLAWGSPGGANVVPPGLVTLPLPVIARGSVNTSIPGSYALTYLVTNDSGAVAIATRRVIVADTTAPVLTLIGSNPITLDLGSPFIDPGAIATDACAGDLTANIGSSGTVNTTVPNSYTITYTVSDPSGNAATNTRTVLVLGRPAILGFNAFFSGTNAVTGSPVVQFLADVNPNGLPTLAFAQYGLTTQYPGRTASVNLPASYYTSTFYATLDGLIPGATYHFRVVATNSLGSTFGPDQAFTVPAIFRAGDVNGDGRVDPGELLSVVSNYFSTSVSGLIMTNSLALSHGLFQFGLTNDTGWNFRVLVSTNLTDWQVLPGHATPVWQLFDPAASNQPQRFYRILWP